MPESDRKGESIMSENPVIHTLRTRRACRSYKPEQVREEDLAPILEAGTWAPTGMGRQSPRIAVVQNPDDLAALERLNGGVMGNPDSHPFYGAPTVLVVFADATIPTYLADGNLVIGNLLNAAAAVGVDSCYIWRATEVFDSDEGKALMKKWGVPETCRGIGNVILGYGREGGTREPAPRREDYIIRV
jgi:hypothetical protein